MTRGLLLAAALVIGCTKENETSAVPRGPNIILISIDTLRADHLGAYGYARDVSPNLDRLAARGVVFERAISQAPWTLPSHASMMASELPSVLGTGTFSSPRALHPDAPALAEVLLDAGYRTYAVTGGGYVSSTFGLDQGFERFEERLSRLDATKTFGVGTAWLDGLGDQRPFFLFLHTFEVHAYDPPEEILRELWADGAPDSALRNKQDLARFLQTSQNHDAVKEFQPADWKCAIDLYDGALMSVDRALGDFVAGLEERGLLDDTIILVTSDHGEEHGEHGKSGHGYNLHDENMLVPFLIAGPGIAPGRAAEMVRLLDVAPTLVEAVGVAPPPGWKGVGLGAAMNGDAPALTAISEAAHVDLKAVRADGFEYVIDLWQEKEALLQDGVDVTAREPEALARLRAAMADHVRSSANDDRFRGGSETELSAEKLAELQELGYTGESGSGTDRTKAWLELLRKLSSS